MDSGWFFHEFPGFFMIFVVFDEVFLVFYVFFMVLEGQEGLGWVGFRSVKVSGEDSRLGKAPVVPRRTPTHHLASASEGYRIRDG